MTGCNTGLGQGMAVALARAGADIVGPNTTAPTETAATVTALGHGFHAIRANLADIAGLPSVVEEACQAFGHIDILVNNAGIIRREDSLNFSEKDWDEVVDLNLKTVFFLSQAAARRFIVQDSPGKIINIASMLSFQGGIRVPSYTASKSGVVGLTRLLACEWASKRINVNAIAPGYMTTNNTAALRADARRGAARKSWGAFQQTAGGCRKTWPVRWFFLPRPPRTM